MMKRTSRALALVLAIALIVLSFAACGKTDAPDTGSATVVVGEKAYTVPLDKVEVTEGAFSLLVYLKENEGLTCEATNSDYGKYITALGDLDLSAQNSYICIYTSVEKDFDVSQYATEKEYNGTKLVSSGLGISSMTVEAGAIYLFDVATY